MTTTKNFNSSFTSTPPQFHRVEFTTWIETNPGEHEITLRVDIKEGQQLAYCIKKEILDLSGVEVIRYSCEKMGARALGDLLFADYHKALATARIKGDAVYENLKPQKTY